MVTVSNDMCASNKLEILCPTSGNSKYDNYCTHCFAHLFPTDPRTEQIRTKSKEIAVLNHLYQYSWFNGFRHDKPLFVDLEGGCCASKRRIDLRKLIGSVVTRGDPFFKVAPLHSWTLELEVPESASANLTSGLGGFFASYAQPAQTGELTVSRVLPEAQIRRGNNVYVAEAEVVTPANWLRPGLEGVAKVHLGRRRVWWIVLHRAVDYLRMNLWL